MGEASCTTCMTNPAAMLRPNPANRPPTITIDLRSDWVGTEAFAGWVVAAAAGPGLPSAGCCSSMAQSCQPGHILTHGSLLLALRSAGGGSADEDSLPAPAGLRQPARRGPRRTASM